MTTAPQPCSRIWDDLDVAAWGTAAQARLVVALEQNGSWGRTAATESHLDPQLGGRLDGLVAGMGGRLLLIRRPGRHPAVSPSAPAKPSRQCYVARTGPDGWLVSARLADPSVLLALTATHLENAAETARLLGGRVDSRPVLLVCTNGRRDTCCAVRGRAVAGATADAMAAAASSNRPRAVWETSHTGGHRFAPTAVLLPWGRMLARLDAELGVAVLTEAARGELPASILGPRHDRGPMHLDPVEQAAEAWARHAETRTRLDDPVADAAARVQVQVHVGPDLPESCGKTAVTTTSYQIRWREPAPTGERA